jgi:DNA gyrase/topoisomerase IV subunit B
VLIATLFSHQVNRKITYNPGLYKIFDEILVNAADNKQRDGSMDTIKASGLAVMPARCFCVVRRSRSTTKNLLQVEINVAEGSISVLNNGQSIPVEVSAPHVPQSGVDRF